MIRRLGRGRFITFEGGEGAGKSTQVERLRRRLEAREIETVVTREPGGTPRAERIRRSLLAGEAKRFGPFAEAILFSAARMDHLDKVIRPSLARGAFVLCDRFADSTRAYQGVLGAIDLNLIEALERAVVGGDRPDLTLIFDVPADIGHRRAASRRGDGEADRFEAEEGGYHDRLRQAFLGIAEREPDRCMVIDAGRDADTVEADVWRVVAERFLDRPMNVEDKAHAG